MSERELEEIEKDSRQDLEFFPRGGEFDPYPVSGALVEEHVNQRLRLVAEVRRFRAEAKELRKENTKWQKGDSVAVKDLLAHADTLEQENAELRERVGELEGALREIHENVEPHDGASPGGELL